MLFYIKKSLPLELSAIAILASLGLGGIEFFSIPVDLTFSIRIAVYGIVGAVIGAAWNGSVQLGYFIVKGKEYADALVESIAKYFKEAPWYLIVLGGATACAEEVFFRGFIQGQWGIWAATFAFGLAHWGKRDIRIVSIWAFPQGMLLGLVYAISGNLCVSMIAHGLFDIGGFTYFRWFMRGRGEAT